jgi:hypothetical protein
MISKYRIFQISSDYFWGYRVHIDMLKFDDIKSILNYVKQDLKAFLLSRNLQTLAEKVEQCKFHIHAPYNTYTDLINLTTDEEIIYVCDHC